MRRALLLPTALILLAAMPAALPASAAPEAGADTPVQGLICRGNEPFWRIEADGDSATLSRVTGEGTTERRFSGGVSSIDYLDPSWHVWRGKGGDRRKTVVAMVRQQSCTDSMSGQADFDGVGVVSLPGGETLSGCCTLQPRPTMAEADDGAAEGTAGLEGTHWLLEDIEGRGVIDRAQSTLTFDGTRITGRAGCNQMSGQARIDGHAIGFGPLIMTKMACAPALMDQEKRYADALSRVASWQVDDAGKLVLKDGRDMPLLKFAPQDGE